MPGKRQSPHKRHKMRAGRREPASQAAPSRRTAPPASRDERTLRQRISRFAYQQRFKADANRALQLYFGQDGSQDHRYVLDEQEIPGFQEWYIQDYVTSEGERLIDLFAREIGPQLPAAQRQMLDDWRRVNRYRLFEAQEVKPGLGVTVQDLLSGERLEVNDISSSYLLHKWQVFAARPLLVKGRLCFAGSMIPLSPQEKPALLEFARDLWKKYQVQYPHSTLDDFYRDHSLDLVHRQMEIANAPPPAVYTPEGHPVAPCSAHYVLSDPQSVQEMLNEAAEFAYVGPADEDESALAYVWLLRGRSRVPEVPIAEGLMLRTEWMSESGDVSFRSLGDVRLSTNRLELSCLSKERLEVGKALLKRIAGRLLRHLSDTYQDLEEMRESAPPSPLHDISPEIDPAIMDRVLKAERDEWLNSPVVVLNGRSPREAAHDPAMREQIDELFKVIDYIEEQKRQRGEPSLDVADMRRELGLPPLGS
jgi:hypothetical protein